LLNCHYLLIEVKYSLPVVDFPDEVASQRLSILPSSFYKAETWSVTSSDSDCDSESSAVDSDSGYGITRRRSSSLSCCCAVRRCLDDDGTSLVLVTPRHWPPPPSSRVSTTSTSYDVADTESRSRCTESVPHGTAVTSSSSSSTVNVGVNTTTISSCQQPTHHIVCSHHTGQQEKNVQLY